MSRQPDDTRQDETQTSDSTAKGSSEERNDREAAWPEETIPHDHEPASEAEEDAASAGEDDASADEDEQEDRAGGQQPDPKDAIIQRLEEQLRQRDEKLRQQEETLREYIRAHKKAQSEFEEYKQRLKRDHDREAEAARAKAVENLLEVFDNLERSLDAVRQGGSTEQLQQGVEMVAKQFRERLEELGLTYHDPTGEPFDPTRMEAMNVVPVNDPDQANKVVSTIKVGFRYGDRELRPALVQVGQYNG